MNMAQARTLKDVQLRLVEQTRRITELETQVVNAAKTVNALTKRIEALESKPNRRNQKNG